MGDFIWAGTGTEPQRAGHPRFYEIIQELADLHERKNHDYSAGDPLRNLRRCQELGIRPFIGTLVRLQDKWSRITVLAREPAQVKNESIKDSLRDSAVYSILALILLEEEEAERGNSPQGA
jgi:hypothetical protein